MQAKAAFREAWINAERNAIVAPVGGYVAQRSVQVGSRVQPGQPLMTVMPLHDLWIDANFKESQLRNIRIGQPVDGRDAISTAARPNTTARSSASAPAPAARSRCCRRRTRPATGSRSCSACRCASRWIRKELDKHPLRVGLSTAVKVDTHDRSGTRAGARRRRRSRSPQTDVYAHDFAKAEAEADAIVARQPRPPRRTERRAMADSRARRHAAAAAARRAAGAADDRGRVRDVHGSARHHDRQRVGAAHRRQPRRESAGRHLGDQLVFAGERDHAAAVRLARPPLRRSAELLRLGAAVRRHVDAVRTRHQHADAGRRPPAAGRRLRARWSRCR